MSLQVKFIWKRQLRPKRVVENPPKQSGDGSSAASCSRKKMKESNPQKYKSYLRKDAERKRRDYLIKAASQTEKQKEEQRQKWRDSKRNQRQHDQQKRGRPREKVKVKDMNVEQRREYDRERRRYSRAKQSRQKQQATRERETKRRKLSRSDKVDDHVDVCMPSMPTTPTQDRLDPAEQPSTCSSSLSTIYRKKNKAKSMLPKSPRSFAAVVEKIITDATPRKQKEMEKRGIKRKLGDEFETVRSIQATVGEMKTKMTEEKRQRYNLIMHACTKTAKYRNAKQIASFLGFGGKVKRKIQGFRKQKVTLTRKRRKDATDQQTVEKVQNHWYSEGISRIVPLKKKVKKGKPLYVLETSYTGAYKKFKACNPNVKIGYITFLKLRPKNVRHLKAMERSVCCCQKCENVQLKLKALNKTVKQYARDDLVLADIDDLSDKTLCTYDKNTYPKKACVERNCSRCSTSSVSHWYRPLFGQLKDEVVEFHEWSNEKHKKLIKVKGKEKPEEKVLSSLRLVTRKAPFKELVGLLESAMKLLSGHLFRAKWQAQQYRLSKEIMPGKSAVLVADFAENFACSMNNEVQSYHWAQSQVTIHPIMAHINDTSNPHAPTHTESIYAITDDPQHDAAAVDTFLTIAFNFLKDKYGIKSVTLWSDCAASQYRSKTSFADMTFVQQKTGLKLSRHFFEPSHGKSEADGLAAVVKHAATLAVTRDQSIIRNAEEFYRFCQNNLATVGAGIFHSREQKYRSAGRKFFLVSPEDINRDRPERSVQPVKGTMSIHSVLPTGSAYKLQLRKLSCCCSNCYIGQNSKESKNCLNTEIVDEWSLHELKPVHSLPVPVLPVSVVTAGILCMLLIILNFKILSY